MKKYYYIISLLGVFAFSSCEKILMEKELSDDATNNFEVLSKIISEKYSYITLKDINWDSIVSANRVKITNDMNVLEEFQVYDDMLYTLKDGHVNLISGFNKSRNWDWYLDRPSNFDWNIIEREYLGDNYFISGGLKHTTLDEDKYGYVYYGSFSYSVSYIEFVKAYLKSKKVTGMIIDVRNNGGGYLKYAKDFANAFTDKERLGYKEYYKTGVNKDDFSKATNHMIKPEGEKWDKPIVIITNRKCYSSTSFFVTMMKELPNVTVLGDDTGGGAGLPVDYTLPNGWYLRFSTTRATNALGEDFELGVKADEYLDLDKDLALTGKDNLIERAKAIIDGL